VKTQYRYRWRCILYHCPGRSCLDLQLTAVNTKHWLRVDCRSLCVLHWLHGMRHKPSVLLIIRAIGCTLSTTMRGKRNTAGQIQAGSTLPYWNNEYPTRILDIPGTMKSRTLHGWHVPILEMTTLAAVMISCDLHPCGKEHFFCLLYCAQLMWKVNARNYSNKYARNEHCDHNSFWLCCIHRHITLHERQAKRFRTR
jgi:hypothetical protein